MLKDNIKVYLGKKEIEETDYPDCFSLSLVIDFVKMAESMGVKAMKVENAEDSRKAIEEMLSANEPFLIDLIISK